LGRGRLVEFSELCPYACDGRCRAAEQRGDVGESWFDPRVDRVMNPWSLFVLGRLDSIHHLGKRGSVQNKRGSNRTVHNFILV
jgi:hypothetical protein